jgi:GTP-binding protein LepA
MERTGALTQREMTEQFLDAMDLEKERGITIKQHSVRLNYKAKDGEDYVLNLIDTPGHVDFAYEVSRSLAACQGALLVVDASQGVEAQTLANAHLAADAGLEIIPVLNKIDLPGAEPEKAKEQIEHVIGIDASGAIPASAKAGIGIEEILEAIVHRLPPPHGNPEGPLRALVFDSWFDQYKGVVILVHVVDGVLEPKQKVKLMATGGAYEVEHLGVFTPRAEPVARLAAGEVGFVVAGIKKVSDVAIGDTLTDARKPAPDPLPGFKEVKPMVFAGLYPVDADQYAELRDALEKLRLNDSSFFYEPETSAALGFGFRCGFLGLLHMEIVEERLEREFDLELLVTAPSVRYRVKKTNGEVVEVDSPARLPDPGSIDSIEEPIITATILTGDEFVGPILKLCQEKRGIQKGIHYITTKRVMIEYELPLNEILLDFYDRLKSASKGYASLDYQFTGH